MGVVGGVSTTPNNNPTRIGGSITQAMLQQQQQQQQQQQHLQQLKHFQRQQMFIQQQQLRQQQQQMLKAAGMTTTPQNTTNIATRPLNGFANQRPVNPYYNTANYYGGWPGQPQYNWGVAPRPAMNNFTQNVNNSSIISGPTSNNPVQWTGQTSLKPNAGNIPQHIPGLEQRFQNVNLKR